MHNRKPDLLFLLSVFWAVGLAFTGLAYKPLNINHLVFETYDLHSLSARQAKIQEFCFGDSKVHRDIVRCRRNLVK